MKYILFYNIDELSKNIFLKSYIDDGYKILEEKEGKHLHLWIMPRHDWMYSLCDGIINDIGRIREYAKNNFRNEDVYKQIITENCR